MVMRHYIEKTVNNWTIQKRTLYDQKYLQPLCVFIQKLFEEIFGSDIMKKEAVLLYNDSEASCPMLIINRTPIVIRTCAVDLRYWSQFIYQFSHELTHYVIRQHRHKGDGKIKWFEETVCEAMSLYILWQSSEKWSKCTLAKENPNYNNCLRKYLSDERNCAADNKSALKKCHTASDLQKIEQTCEDRRSDRFQERNYLYELFRKNPEYMPMIVAYSHYAHDNLLIDLDQWLQDIDESGLILKLRQIQPNVE